VNHFRQSASCIELGNIQVAREFNHVDDVCNVYVRLMLSNAKSVVVNVCSGREVYLNDILAILNKMAGYEIEVRVNQSFVRENEIFVLKGSNNLLNSLISYSFQKDIGITLHEMFFVDDNS
jgi:nucleoside-diphosphate-sugar epimerase